MRGLASSVSIMIAASWLLGSGVVSAVGTNRSPLDDLPPYIKQVTHFGQRADWSHDGKRILFIEKTFGDVYELELETGIIRPMTHHYFHEGYTRALYLANGDILLSGARQFDANNPWASRSEKHAELWVLKKDLSAPPVPLGQKCSEGPAVSREQMRIAWTQQGAFYMADIVYKNGRPMLANKKKILDKRNLPFECAVETQNFRPPDEKELIFSAYGYQGTEVMGLEIATGKVTNYSKAPGQYDEPEGIFPDGRYTCVECDKHCHKGVQYIDIYKLALDGSGRTERLTNFADYAGYKASNPVVSDDGRYLAFQLAHRGDVAGVGRGILVMDLVMREQMKQAAGRIEKQLEQIRKRYGVKVHVWYDAETFFPKQWLAEPICGQGQQMPIEEIDRVLDVLEEFLRAYPQSVIRDNLRDIYLVGKMKFYGKAFGGAYGSSSLYISNEGSERGYTRQFLLSTMHSELSSILLRNFAEDFAREAWEAANPPGWQYMGTGVEMLGQPDIFAQSQQLLAQGFLVKYSQSSLENDLNMFAFWAFTRGHELRQLAFRYDRLGRKYQLFRQFYRKIHPQLSAKIDEAASKSTRVDRRRAG